MASGIVAQGVGVNALDVIESVKKARRDLEGRPLTLADPYDAVMEGAVERVRPKMMTVVSIKAGLLPIMCSAWRCRWSA